jgi:hypothetical protein
VAIFIVRCSGPKLVFWQCVNHQILDKLCLLPIMAVFVVVKSYPVTGLDRPLWLQEVEVPRISRQRCQPYASAAFTPQEISRILIFVRG